MNLGIAYPHALASTADERLAWAGKRRLLEGRGHVTVDLA